MQVWKEAAVKDEETWRGAVARSEQAALSSQTHTVKAALTIHWEL